jgi:predicted DNA-binding protein with PD1-like motif
MGVRFDVDFGGAEMRMIMMVAARSGDGDHMEIARKDQFIVIRLDHGEDILESIKSNMKEERSTMLIVMGLGMISDFELGYFDQGNYIKKSFDDPHELLALQGSISTEGDPRIHLHATVADKYHEAYGGHLMRGKAWMSNEIGLIRLERLVSVRAFDPEKKVGILHLKK